MGTTKQWVVEYVREEEKRHSVRYVPKTKDPVDDVLGTIYVRRITGLTTAKTLRVTIEAVD